MRWGQISDFKVDRADSGIQEIKRCESIQKNLHTINDESRIYTRAHTDAPNDVVHDHFSDHHALRSAETAEGRVGRQVGAAHTAARSEKTIKVWAKRGQRKGEAVKGQEARWRGQRGKGRWMGECQCKRRRGRLKTKIGEQKYGGGRQKYSHMFHEKQNR